MVCTAKLKSAVYNPTKRSRVTYAPAAIKLFTRVWDTMFVCHPKHQTYADIGTTPAGIADRNFLKCVVQHFELRT